MVSNKIVLKNTIVILLIVGLLSSSFSKLVVFSNYLLNKDVITNKFCENKSKPKLKCNGKCHLKKQLKEQEKQEEQSKNSVKEINEIQLFSVNSQLQLRSPFIALVTPNIGYVQKPLSQLSISFFHPPTC